MHTATFNIGQNQNKYRNSSRERLGLTFPQRILARTEEKLRDDVINSRRQFRFKATVQVFNNWKITYYRTFFNDNKNMFLNTLSEFGDVTL